jgi:phytoene synthase
VSDSGLAADDIAYSAKLVRETDRPRYYSALFASERLRRDLFSLYGFAAEIERVPDQVSEPTLGEMRLRWWQDALEQAVSGEVQGESPAVRAAAATIAGHSLPIAPFASLIEARAADLYADAPATLIDVEGRLGETQSALFQLAAIAAGAPPADSAEPAGHAGIAYGLARRLSTFAAERARGRTILPMDLLAMEDLKPADIFTRDPPGGVQKTVLALASFARHHVRLARAALDRVPQAAIPAFLPLAVVEPLLRRVERLGTAIVTQNAGLSDLEILVRIGAARLRGTGSRRKGP